MSFSERERFIYHAATLMTMQHLQALSKSDLQKNLRAVQNNRCAGLTDKQVERIFLDVEHEVLEMMSCLLYTSPSPRDLSTSRMPSSA